MSEHTRRQFIGSVGSAAVTTVLAPGALAAGRPAAVSRKSAPWRTPASPSTYYAYQSEIYLRGMTGGGTPKITTNLSKLEADASKVLDPQARNYFLASAGGRGAARANARAFRGWRIIPRMFLDRAERDLSATILGTRMPAPVICAPVGRQRLAHPDGELASARAAAALGLTYIQATRASYSIEEVAAANGTGSRWYQLDWPRDDDLDVDSLRSARVAGYTHLLITPPRPGQSWKPLRLIRKSWDGPILLTGIQTVRDAKLAAKRRFDGIVVSNHARPARRRRDRVSRRAAADRRRSRRSTLGLVRLRNPHRPGHLQGAHAGRRRRPGRPPVRLWPGPGRASGCHPRPADTARRVRPHSRRRRLQKPPRPQARLPRQGRLTGEHTFRPSRARYLHHGKASLAGLSCRGPFARADRRVRRQGPVDDRLLVQEARTRARPREPVHAPRGGVLGATGSCRLSKRAVDTREIAAALERSTATVRRWLRVFDLETVRTQSPSDGAKGLTSRQLECVVYGHTAFTRSYDSGRLLAACGVGRRRVAAGDAASSGMSGRRGWRALSCSAVTTAARRRSSSIMSIRDEKSFALSPQRCYPSPGARLVKRPQVHPTLR